MPESVTILEFDAALHGSALGLREIWRDAYTLEAELAQNPNFWPLTRDPVSATDGARWLGAFADRVLVGALEFNVRDHDVEIDSLVVAPVWHRRGVANALVTHVLQSVNWSCAWVSTAAANHPARQLYERFGFVVVASRVESDGTKTVQLKCRERPSL